MGRVNRPTDGELEILRVLWARGKSTVRQVHNALAQTKQTGYNTTLKLMQIMLEKGVITRDDTERPQVYQASFPEELTQRQLVSDFLDRVFGGSARKMVAALTQTHISRDEMAQIRKLLGKTKPPAEERGTGVSPVIQPRENTREAHGRDAHATTTGTSSTRKQGKDHGHSDQ